MALIKCPECGHEVSDTCEKCIHCGYQLKKPQNDNYGTHSNHVHIESHASKIYERNQRARWIGEIVASVILILIGIALFICCAIPVINGDRTLVIVFVVCGIIAVIGGIGAIIYYKYRLDNY